MYSRSISRAVLLPGWGLYVTELRDLLASSLSAGTAEIARVRATLIPLIKREQEHAQASLAPLIDYGQWQYLSVDEAVANLKAVIKSSKLLLTFWRRRFVEMRRMAVVAPVVMGWLDGDLATLSAGAHEYNTRLSRWTACSPSQASFAVTRS